MRITEIRVHRHEIRVDGGRYQMAISAVASLDSTVVEIVTDVGLHGFGETTPLGPTYQPQHALGARAAIAQMAPAMLGVDPRRLELVRRAMDGALNGHNYAKTAIDVACWDLRGKAYDERICDLLGGTDQSSVPSYFGVMPDTAAATADMARAKQDAGYRRLQVKVGGRPLAEDIEATRAVAAVIDPDTRLLVDANRGWTGRDTIEFSTACRNVRLSIENPCRTYDEHRAVASKLHHPLFLDECSTDIGAVNRAIQDGVAQGFGMKLSRIGGLTPLQTVRDLCIHHAVPLTIDDTWGGDLTAAATIHMGATVPSAFYEGTWISAPYQHDAYPTHSPTIRPVDGRIHIPDGPGLGVIPATEAWGEPVAIFR